MFGNLQKFSEMFGNVRVTFGQVLENLQKFLESGRKSLENRLIVRLCIFFGGQ